MALLKETIGARLTEEKNVIIQIEHSETFQEIIAILEMDTKENALKVIRGINEHCISAWYVKEGD